jgi:hypothetical protein
VRRATTTPSAITIGDALRSLAQPGCPVCRYTDDAAGRFFTWFAIETASVPNMIIRLRNSGGMCATHTRRLLHQNGADSRLTSLYREILPALRARVAAAEADDLACPACESGEEAVAAAWDSMRDALADERVRRRYAHADGLCMPHLLRVFDSELPARATLLAHSAANRLSRQQDLLATLAGTDAEAPLRARWRALLPTTGTLGEADADPVDTLSRQRARLAVRACPVCLAEGQSERRYLIWLASEYHREPHGLDHEPGGFCPRHLHDLTVLDPPVADWALRRECHRWADRLARSLSILDPARPDGDSSALASADRRERRPDGGLDALLGARRSTQERIREAIRREPCMVCRAVQATAVGETGLLLAALRDRSVAAAYETAAGLCLHHVRSLAVDGEVAALAQRVALARADLLSHELSEASRKTGWLARHEAKGPETTAWVRAPALIDGRVFLGGPPRTPDRASV